MAACSAGTGAIPLPVVGSVIDVALIGATLAIYYREFGLEHKTPEELALLDKKHKEIIVRYSLRSATELAANIATKSIGVLLAVEEVSKFIPVIGLAIAGSISFALTLRYLLRSIDELEDAALAVLDNVAERSSQDGPTACTDE